MTELNKIVNSVFDYLFVCEYKQFQKVYAHFFLSDNCNSQYLLRCILTYNK